MSIGPEYIMAKPIRSKWELEEELERTRHLLGQLITAVENGGLVLASKMVNEARTLLGETKP